jgi:sugar phosphate isomerase/epimerase
MQLGLSTSWNSFRRRQPRELFFEIRATGFRGLELSFNLTAAMVREISALCRRHRMQIISVHNFCPVPAGLKWQQALPDCFSLASADEAQRRQAVRYTRRSIDTASSVGAKALVVHCGRVEIADCTRQLIRLYASGLYSSRRFIRLRDDFIRQRVKVQHPHLDNALRSLDELNRYAERKNILLGLENRFYYREIPSFAEFGIILDKFKGSNVRYWHDSGHAQVMENLGFVARHEDFLTAYSAALIGLHLHNLTDCRDHQAPVQGSFDFRRLKPYIQRQTLLVIEAHYPATAVELKASKVLLEGIFGE